MQSSVLFTCLAVALALSMPASADSNQASRDLYLRHNFRYERPQLKAPAPEDFIILPWGMTPGDEQVLKDIKDCGFNVAGFVAPEFVGAVEKSGLKCFVDDPNVASVLGDENITDAEITKRVDAMTARCKDNPCVFGYYLVDEPAASRFASLGRWAKAIRKADPGSEPYINLFPIVAPGLGGENYNRYLDEFIKKTDSTYISYDHYALGSDGSVSPTLYQNLEYVRNFTNKHNIKFWNCILSNSHGPYPAVTQGGLNLQVYATLAYGGRGISYFTYFAPLGGNNRNAALDQFLNKTPTWDMLRFINLQIHALAPTYLKLKSVNVFHHPNVPDGCLGLTASKYLSEVNGGDFLIGEFEGPDNTPYIIIVNKDIKNSVNFHVKFKDQGKVIQTSEWTGKIYPYGGEDECLSPGSGALLSLQKTENEK